MDLRRLLHCFATWILRTTSTRRRESYGEVQEGISAVVGPACGERTTRSARGLGHRAGLGALRSRDLLGHGGVRAGQGRSAAAVSAPGTRDSQSRHVQPPIPFAQAGSLQGGFPALYGGVCQGQQAHRVIAVDGKALRGAFERGSRHEPLHLVNVWAVEARMSLAQQKASGRSETKGALEVLASLKGGIITADALHCHRAMDRTVLDRGVAYVVASKANRGPLFKAVVAQFARSGARSTTRKIEPSTHDRGEARRATIMRNTSLAAVHGFPGVVAIGRITSRRQLQGNRAEPRFMRYYLLSKSMSAKRLLQVTRSYWTIENQLHWVLDSTSTSTRTATGREWTMLPRILPACAGLHSTSFDLAPVPQA